MKKITSWVRILCIVPLFFGANFGSPAYPVVPLFSSWFQEPEPPKLPTATKIFLPLVMSPNEISWSTVGANPQRTSWTPEEVRGQLVPLWYKPIQPFVPSKTQILAEKNTLFVTTNAGIYAISTDTSDVLWIYPTQMPPGNTPTISNGILYFGGYDHLLHAVEAFPNRSGLPVDSTTGYRINNRRIFTFSAQKGFDTNPLVLNDMIYAGNRDGYLYAIYAAEHPKAGQLAWKFKTGGPVLYSAAASVDGSRIYVASNDSYAYALDASNGNLTWKSNKLPGAGFHTWWPVVYQDQNDREWVVFSGSKNYRTTLSPGPTRQFSEIEREDIYPDNVADGWFVGPLGSAPGNWVANTPTIDASGSERTPQGSTTPITEYLEQKPYRRTYFVLDGLSGQEYTTDFDKDGKPEYAPILWFGTHSGNRYPPIVGPDKVLYQTNNYLSNTYIAWGHVSGWQIGTPYLSLVSSDRTAVDEPATYSMGGNVIYWAEVCNLEGGAFDVSIPNTGYADSYRAGDRPPHNTASGREWNYYDRNLKDKVPQLWKYFPSGLYGSPNGSYGCTEFESPLIPYQGKVYTIRTNTLIAFGAGTQGGARDDVRTVKTQESLATIPTTDELKTQLASEVQKMIDAGHLMPGYFGSGIYDFISSRWCGGDRLVDYFHYPSDTIQTLVRALPYLPADLKERTRTYLQQEYNKYPISSVDHIGWRDGQKRDVFDFPPEVEADRVYFTPWSQIYDVESWSHPPQQFYGLLLYAKEFGNARTLFNAAKYKLESPPSDSYLLSYPIAHNAYITGYYSYLELEKLAGYSESASVRQTYNHLLALRIQNFDKDVHRSVTLEEWYCNTLNPAKNFMYLAPETFAVLNTSLSTQFSAAIDEYQAAVPYWFVSRYDQAIAENVFQPLDTYHALFQAKALAQHTPYEELVKYLDVPAFTTGDLFYIDNIITAIEAGTGTP